MTNNYILSALMCLAAVSFTGCIAESLENITPAQKGDEIVFGARAGFENSDPDTRTTYSGVTYNTENGATFERINWVDGDKIEIYSPDALNADNSHYKVVNIQDAENGNGPEYASLERYSGSGLQWGSGSDENGTHTFYAMYPSSKYFEEGKDESNVVSGVKMDKETVRGVVPISQTPASFEVKEVEGAIQYIAHPDMRYAYMVAKSTATPAKNNVSLTFVPIVTALQVELVMPEKVGEGSQNMNVVNIGEVRVEGENIAGSFASNLADWNGTYPACNVNGSDQISISMWQKQSDGSRKPLSMTPGSKLTFTVFLLPGADINTIKISFSDGSASFVGKTLTGTGIIPTYKKTVIKNLQLPTKEFKVEVGDWMSQIDQNTSFNRLSIPGAGAAFSKNGGDGYSSQSLTFSELWDTGIRAFEIITDRQSGSSFGNESLRCNNEPVSGWNVSKVMTEVTDRLSNSDECAILIFTYQPTGSMIYPREAATYVTNLCNYFKGYTTHLVKYSPDLTLAEAKGKIIVIVRPTQLGEDSDNEISGALTAAAKVDAGGGKTMSDYILIVSGCGTAKDKWGTRGYSNNGTASPEQGSYNWKTSNVEYSIARNSWGTVSKKDAVYAYDVNVSAEETPYQAWYQEWARVVGETNNNGLDDQVVTFGNFHWRESYNEKLADAKKAFDMAMSGKYDGNSESKAYVFINSLSGFYVTEEYDLSSKPLDPTSTIFNGSYFEGGSQGDIAGLAADLNEDFYQYVLSKEDQTGATGIVMMDFVANELKTVEGIPTNPGSYYLPGVIVNNNFKFNQIEVPSVNP